MWLLFAGRYKKGVCLNPNPLLHWLIRLKIPAFFGFLCRGLQCLLPKTEGRHFYCACKWPLPQGEWMLWQGLGIMKERSQPEQNRAGFGASFLQTADRKFFFH